MVPEEQWRKHADDLIRLATTLVGPSDAEDLVVSAYVRAVTSNHWATVRNERGYLMRAVTNEAANHHCARSRRRAREQRAIAGQPDGHGIDAADVDALRLIARLSIRQRSIVWMAYWLDSTSEEIAADLQISRRTVDRELERARQQLKKELT